MSKLRFFGLDVHKDTIVIATFASPGTSILVFVPSLFVIVMMITPSNSSAAVPPAASSHLRFGLRGGTPRFKGSSKVADSLRKTIVEADEACGCASAN